MYNHLSPDSYVLNDCDPLLRQTPSYREPREPAMTVARVAMYRAHYRASAGSRRLILTTFSHREPGASSVVLCSCTVSRHFDESQRSS
jgi:hypothetical protein